MYIYTQTDHQPQLSDSIFIFSQNGQHRIVGYQRQRRINLCCLQKSIRWRYLRRQKVKLKLDLDMPWCLLGGSIFKFLDAANHKPCAPTKHDMNTQLMWTLTSRVFTQNITWKHTANENTNRVPHRTQQHKNDKTRRYMSVSKPRINQTGVTELTM